MALATGMREGELLGLKWSDVDWVKGQLHVHRQLQQTRVNGNRLVSPKTKAGIRQIKLGPGNLEPADYTPKTAGAAEGSKR